MNQEIVALVDFEQVARADKGRHGALLDQQRPLELAGRPQVGAVVHRHVAPAVRRIDPDLARLARLWTCLLRRPGGRRRPVEPAAVYHTKCRDVDAAARLDMAEQALMLLLEGLARGDGIET